MAWAPDYVTVEELRAYATRSASTVDDVDLAVVIAEASRTVDRYTGRQFGKVSAAEARHWTAEYDRRRGRWIIDTDDISSVTNLAVAVGDEEGTWDQPITEYSLWPYNAAQNGRPWERIIVEAGSTVKPTAREAACEVTALYGWAAVPTAVKGATLIEANRFFMRRISAFGVAGSPESGSELRLLRGVDVDAQKALDPYRKLWGAA